jgi:hypothetical protein
MTGIGNKLPVYVVVWWIWKSLDQSFNNVCFPQ